MQHFNFKVAQIIAGVDSPLFSIVFHRALSQDSKLRNTVEITSPFDHITPVPPGWFSQTLCVKNSA